MEECEQTKSEDPVKNYIANNASEGVFGEEMPKKIVDLLQNQNEKTKKAIKLLYIRLTTMMAAEHIKNDGVPIEIVDGLFIGSIGTALSKENLKKANISCILSCANLKPAYPEDFEYKVLNIKDSLDQQVSDLFEESNEFITRNLEAGKKILIHWYPIAITKI